MKTGENIRKVIFSVSVFTGLLIVMIIFSASLLPYNASANEEFNMLMADELSDDNNPIENIFVLFQGLSGEVNESGHKGWCEAYSIEQGHYADSGSIYARPSTYAVFDDIIIVKNIDKASPKLAEALCIGSVIPKVEIDVTASFNSSTHPTFYSYQLGEVRVTSYNISISGDADDRPTEELTLSFERIKVTYTEFDENGKPLGNVEYEWDLTQGVVMK